MTCAETEVIWIWICTLQGPFLVIFAMELGERNANIIFLRKKNNLCGSILQSLFQIFKNWLKRIWLSAKRGANGGSDFWLSIKSVSNTLSCCCFACAFIIGLYHIENNMSSKSGAAGEILFFESEKRHEILTPENGHAHAFIHVHDESKHYLSHRFAQRRYRFTQCV